MITMTWSAAPADYLGLGGSDVRPCTGLRPRTVVQGTAVPFAPERQLSVAPTGNGLVVDLHVQKSIAPTTGTTLGIHPSRRPQS
jgi:hypothetical protein